MDKKPLVSIVIATYNSSSVVRNSLESVIKQKLQNWECLVIDGASSDNTIEIVKEYSLKDNRIKYISEPDNGIYDAFNKGWKNAKGEWIYYLGSDDELLPDGLYNLINSCKLSEYDVVYGHVYDKFSDSKVVCSKTVGHKGLPYRMPANHQAIITRKKIIEKFSGFDDNLRIIGDKEFFVRLYLYGGIKFFHAKNIYVTNFLTGGASSNFYAMLNEEWYIYKKNNMGFKYIAFQITRFLWLKTKEIFKIKKATKL